MELPVAFFLFCALLLYFLPSIIGRNKKNATAIFIVNLFLGWTLVGWVVALAWAFTVEALPPAPISVSVTTAVAAPPARMLSTPVTQSGFLCRQCGKYSESSGAFCPQCGAPRQPQISPGS
jgi:hypothetical protein